MIKLCHDAGFKFQKPNEIVISKMRDDAQNVFKVMQTLPTLKSLCRIEVRRNLGSPLSRILRTTTQEEKKTLHLPELIIEYLMFTEQCAMSRDELGKLFDSTIDLDDDDDDEWVGTLLSR